MKKCVLTYVVEQGANPSSAYFVTPFLKNLSYSIKYFNGDVLPDAPSGALIVFVRYIPRIWRLWVDANRDYLSGIVLFIDDDVLDFKASAGMPWRYRWKLWRSAGTHQSWLRCHDATLLVSTPHLQRKYADWPAILIHPSSSHIQTDSYRRIFYHGTASHGLEQAWLKLVVPAVLAENPHVVFEIIGDRHVSRAWRHVPRVTVIHPMRWDAYLAFSTLDARHIGLAPMLYSQFNAARSYTKFFDITRSGAVGVYADHPAFSDVVHHGVDGLLLPSDPQVWAEAILRLIDDEPMRLRMRDAARQRVDALNYDALMSHTAVHGLADSTD